MKFNLIASLSFALVLTANVAHANHVFVKCEGKSLDTPTATGKSVTVSGVFRLSKWTTRYKFGGVVELGDVQNDPGVILNAKNLPSNQYIFTLIDTDSEITSKNLLKLTLPYDTLRGELPKHVSSVPLSGASVKVLRLDGIENPAIENGQIDCKGMITKNGADESTGFFGVIGASLRIVLSNLGALHP